MSSTMCSCDVAVTMKVSDALINTWQTAAEQSGNSPGYYRRRLDLDAPMALYAGIILPNNSRQITMRFSSDAFAPRVLLQSSRGYIVTQDQVDSDESKIVDVNICETTPKLPAEIFLLFG